MLVAIMVSAIAVPMAMAQHEDVVSVNVSIENIPPVIHQKWETQTQDGVEVLVGIKSLKCLIDDVNIGDEASEIGHNLPPQGAVGGWGPIEPAASGGQWGSDNAGGDDGNCRVTWEPPDGDRIGSFTMDNTALDADQLLLRVLDGFADDQFEVYINDFLAYAFVDGPRIDEEWITHKIYLDERNPLYASEWNTQVINVDIKATAANPWGSWDTYGQLGVTWAKLFSDCCCEGPVGVVPDDPAIIDKFAIVSDDNGADTISSVIVKLYDPDGNLKETQTLASVDSATAIEIIENAPLCSADKQWKIDLIKAGEVLYMGSFPLYYTDQHGDYKLVYDVIDDAGLVDSLANDIYYMSVVILEMEFSAINYGTVKPGENTWAPGTYTIRNAGNDPMDVKILASDFTGPGTIPGNAFDASFEVDHSNSQLLEPEACFSVGIAPAGGSKEVYFSVNVPIGTQSGAYTGTITLTGEDADLNPCVS